MLISAQSLAKGLKFQIVFLDGINGGMPQSACLGPLIFLVLINDLIAGCLLHKFVDDTTLSVIIPKGSNMSSLVEDILHCSQSNFMNINWCKTKEFVLASDSAKNFS